MQRRLPQTPLAQTSVQQSCGIEHALPGVRHSLMAFTQVCVARLQLAEQQSPFAAQAAPASWQEPESEPKPPPGPTPAPPPVPVAAPAPPPEPASGVWLSSVKDESRTPVPAEPAAPPPPLPSEPLVPHAPIASEPKKSVTYARRYCVIPPSADHSNVTS